MDARFEIAFERGLVRCCLRIGENGAAAKKRSGSENEYTTQREPPVFKTPGIVSFQASVTRPQVC